MAENKKIKTALISVFHKDGLEELLKKLNDEGVKFLSTGGTQTFIESLGYQCEKVENVTTYPSILGGRVKTGGERDDVSLYPRWPCEDFASEGVRRYSGQT